MIFARLRRPLPFLFAVGLLHGSANATESPARSTPKWHPGHYIFVGHGKSRRYIALPQFRGIGVVHVDEARAALDRYVLLDHVISRGCCSKQLVLQIQYKAFGKNARVSAYLQGPEFGGGVYRASSSSWNPVLWNDRVGARIRLFAALGRSSIASQASRPWCCPKPRRRHHSRRIRSRASNRSRRSVMSPR
jgi:hypothetical protein